MEKKMKKNGLTIVGDLFFVVGLVMILAVILIPQFMEPPQNWKHIAPGLETDFTVGLITALPSYEQEAFLAYDVQDRRNYKTVQFRDVGLDGDLDEVHCTSTSGGKKFIFDPNSQYLEGESWSDWIRDFEIVRREVATGLKPGAEEILQAQKKQGEKKK